MSARKTHLKAMEAPTLNSLYSDSDDDEYDQVIMKKHSKPRKSIGKKEERAAKGSSVIKQNANTSFAPFSSSKTPNNARSGLLKSSDSEMDCEDDEHQMPPSPSLQKTKRINGRLVKKTPKPIGASIKRSRESTMRRKINYKEDSDTPEEPESESDSSDPPTHVKSSAKRRRTSSTAPRMQMFRQDANGYKEDFDGLRFHKKDRLLLFEVSGEQKWLQDWAHPVKDEMKYAPSLHILEENVMQYLVGGPVNYKEIQDAQGEPRKGRKLLKVIDHVPSHIRNTSSQTNFKVESIEIWSHYKKNEVKLNWPVEKLTESEALDYQKKIAAKLKITKFKVKDGEEEEKEEEEEEPQAENSSRGSSHHPMFCEDGKEYVEDENSVIHHPDDGVLLLEVDGKQKWKEDWTHPNPNQRKFTPSVHELKEHVYKYIMGGEDGMRELEEARRGKSNVVEMLKKIEEKAHIRDIKNLSNYPVESIEVWTYHKGYQVKFNWPVEDLDKDSAQDYQKAKINAMRNEYMEVDEDLREEFENSIATKYSEEQRLLLQSQLGSHLKDSRENIKLKEKLSKKEKELEASRKENEELKKQLELLKSSERIKDDSLFIARKAADINEKKVAELKKIVEEKDAQLLQQRTNDARLEASAERIRAMNAEVFNLRGQSQARLDALVLKQNEATSYHSLAENLHRRLVVAEQQLDAAEVNRRRLLEEKRKVQEELDTEKQKVATGENAAHALTVQLMNKDKELNEQRVAIQRMNEIINFLKMKLSNAANA